MQPIANQRRGENKEIGANLEQLATTMTTRANGVDEGKSGGKDTTKGSGKGTNDAGGEGEGSGDESHAAS